jgi:hypothetical protein
VIFLQRRSQAKRTTIILDDKEREYIDSLIKEGKEPGIKHLVSKMLDIYRTMMIHDWKYPGEYYFGISRVAFVNVEFINILLKQIPKEKWLETGKEIGEAAKISLEATMDLKAEDPDNWPEVFKQLQVQGFGEFYLRDKYLIIKSPFINNAEVFCGFSTTLLGIQLEMRASNPPFVFEKVG